MEINKLISEEYKKLNLKLHADNLLYGIGGGKHVKAVLKLIDDLKNQLGKEDISVLDYGCGKGHLAKGIPFPIYEYDPAVVGKEEPPNPADLVVCTDVLEHIEPDKLLLVLNDLKRCVKHIGFFIIAMRPAVKKLADGRNAHLIIQNQEWWVQKLKYFFNIVEITNNIKLKELTIIVTTN